MKKKLVTCCIICCTVLFLQACGAVTVSVPSAEVQYGSVEETAAADSVMTQNTEPKEEKAEETKEESAPEDDETAGEIPDLKEILRDTANVKDDGIAFFHQDDFDGDGTEEAFAIVGERTEFDEDPDSGGIIDGNVWFVGPDDCMMLTELSGMGFVGEDRVMTLGGRNYIMFDEAYATGALSYVWNVSDGKPVEAEISKIGTVIMDPDREDRFCIMDSSYDFEYDAETDVVLGHTWKYYYFYYDGEEEEIREYGGADISDVTADYLFGGPFAKDLLLPGDEKKDLFYRGNGLIVLNFERPDGDNITYYHYIYDLDKECFIDDEGRETDRETLGGTYLKALCPDMASSPEVPDVE